MVNEYALRPDTWKAKWIWDYDDNKKKNIYVHFRRIFNVSSELEKGILYITACSEYIVWLNGKEVGRGPVTCDPRWQSYDSYDITDLLLNGENVLAVICYYSDEGIEDDSWRKFRSVSPGNIPYSMHSSRPGFLCQIEMSYDKGKSYLVTDDKWKSLLSNAWKCDVPKLDDRTHIEVYDASMWPDYWTDKDYDDSYWKGSVILEDASAFNPLPWVILEPRDMPHYKKREIYPKKVVQVGEVIEYLGEKNPALKISLEKIKKPEFTKILEPESFISGDIIEIKPFENEIAYDEFNGVRSAAIILDLGDIYNGRLSFDVEGSAAGIIDIGYAQRLEDGNPIIYNSRISAADRYIMKEGRQNWSSFGWRHVRYLQITFRNLSKPLFIHDFKVIADEYDEECAGSFCCSNDLFNWIWNASVNTTKVCSHDLFMDAPNRERRQYTAEISDMALSYMSLYGDASIVRRYIRAMMRGQTVYWFLTFCNPSGYERNTLLMNGAIRLFEAIWQHYLRFGDRRLLEEVYIPIRRHIEFMGNYREDNGLIGKQPFFVWQDWSEIDYKDKLLTLNIAYAREQQLAGMIFKELGEHSQAKALLEKFEETRKSIEKIFWDDELGVYVDNVSFENVKYNHISEQGNFMMLSFGYTDKKSADRILEYWKAHENDIGHVSPLWFYYVMDGLFRYSYSKEAFEIMGKCYNKIKESGYTTIPELWSIYGAKAWGKGWKPFDARAVAHGGSVCPVYIVQKYILGVLPASAGYERVEITPGVCELNWASGVVPTPKGEIKISWYRETGKLKLSCELPNGVCGMVNPPNCEEILEVWGKVDLEFRVD